VAVATGYYSDKHDLDALALTGPVKESSAWSSASKPLKVLQSLSLIKSMGADVTVKDVSYSQWLVVVFFSISTLIFSSRLVLSLPFS